jgi:hypothetical protein
MSASARCWRAVSIEFVYGIKKNLDGIKKEPHPELGAKRHVEGRNLLIQHS